MAATFNPTRLDLARRRRGLTKLALATATGVSLRSLVGYAADLREPSSATVSRFADVLQFPTEFFYAPTLDEPPIEGTSFRALSRLTAKQRDQAISAGALALALSDWIVARFDLPSPDIPTYDVIDPETAAMTVRAEWSLGERPIQNMIHLLEAHGVNVFSRTEDNVEMDAFSFWRGDTPYVFLNTMKSTERSRMDAAHELGHLALHARGGARGRDAEREADMFGSALLMPRGSVLAEAPRGARLDQLVKEKRRWTVSVASLTYRMHKLRLLSDWQYRTLFMEMGRRGYRTREPNGAQGESSQVLAKVFNALRQEGVTMNQVASELHVLPDELSKSVFGLILTPITGGGTSDRNAAPHEEPRLKLLTSR